jgi:hypothetical protein
MCCFGQTCDCVFAFGVGDIKANRWQLAFFDKHIAVHALADDARYRSIAKDFRSERFANGTHSPLTKVMVLAAVSVDVETILMYLTESIADRFSVTHRDVLTAGA